ncbi:hypothetical protein Tco_0817360 [Tanacetum coccineum]
MHGLVELCTMQNFFVVSNGGLEGQILVPKPLRIVQLVETRLMVYIVDLVLLCERDGILTLFLANTKSDEVIKSSVEELVPIPSESEGISDGVCDVPLCDNPTPLKAFKDHSEIVVDSNDDDTSRIPQDHEETCLFLSYNHSRLKGGGNNNDNVNPRPIKVCCILSVRTPGVAAFKKVEEISEVEIRLLALSVRTPDVSVV